MIKSICVACNGGIIIVQSGSIAETKECKTCQGKGFILELEAKDIGSVDKMPEAFIMSEKELRVLLKFFFDNGYISHEFFPEIHDMIKRIKKYLGEKI